MLFWRWRDLRLHGHVAIGIAVLALLAVDSTVVGARSGEAAPVMSIGGHPPPARLIGDGFLADAVTSGHGEIWTLRCFAPRPHRRCEVFEIDPSTGVEISAFLIPRPASNLFYGADRLWATGGGRITAIDPVSHHVATERRAGGTIRSMAFHGSTAYAAVVGRDEVLALTGGKRLRTKVIEEKGDPIAVVALPRAIEVTNRDMNLVPVILPGADTSFLATLQLGRPVIAAGGPHVVWVRRGHLLVRETVTRSSHPARQYVATPGAPLRVVTAGDGGCYVSLASVPRSRVNLAYFSRKALTARHPRPTDVHAGARLTDFALDPAGGVVFIDRSGALKRWEPVV
jgi:hypothetical protein